ncbi:MAG: hypothetical protein PHE67_04320 [Campylobacterales bacterium]|nr:hypothetical protein [Campylobacterales bacterium]
MKHYLLLYLVVALQANISAEDVNQTQEEQKSALEIYTDQKRGIKSDKTSTIERTYKSAIDTNDSSKWNSANWAQQSENNGANTGSIGKMQNFFNIDSSNVDVNKINSFNIQNDEEAPNNLKVWTQDFQDELASSAIRNHGLEVGQTIKCYIARDIPIRYKCKKTQISYGGFINSNGLEARNKCESECYEQSQCVEIKEPVIDIENIEAIEINDIVRIGEKSILLTGGTPLDKITMRLTIKDTTKEDTESTTNPLGLYAIIKVFAYLNGTSHMLANTTTRERNLTFPINGSFEKISVVIEQKNQNTKVMADEISVVYKENGKYICPLLQDITLKNPGNYAYLCPSGRVQSFTINGSTYKICEDYGPRGDNKDGTFSNRGGCENACKEKFGCESDISTYNENVLIQFREGCIEGQDNCALETCTELRKFKTPILNETVFNATSKPTQTIVNTSYKEGTYRPKPVTDTDVDFAKKLAQEYKDKAYMKMLGSGTYTSLEANLNQDTFGNDAFGLSVRSDLSSASLYWQYKPSAYQVSEKKYKHIAVVEVFAQRDDYISTIEKQQVRNRVLYVKGSSTDSFKPFAIKENAELTLAQDDSGPKSIENLTAKWEYKTFSGSSWYHISGNNQLEYYDLNKLEIDAVIYRKKIIDDMSKIYTGAISGIVRSVVADGPYDIKNYGGAFNGTGEIISNYRVYSFLVPEDEVYTYQNFIEDIDSGEKKPFFDSLRRASYRQVVEDDGMQKEKIGADEFKIKAYQYGTINKKTGFVEITPKREDVGKSGYIFIFAYDPAVTGGL